MGAGELPSRPRILLKYSRDTHIHGAPEVELVNMFSLLILGVLFFLLALRLASPRDREALRPGCGLRCCPGRFPARPIQCRCDGHQPVPRRAERYAVQGG